MSDTYLRIVAEDEDKEILAMYEYYVKNTAITFEYEPALHAGIQKQNKKHILKISLYSGS